MNGRNLFESRGKFAFGTGKASTGPQPGVFISHSSLDRDKAREIADALRVSRVDYYFDEEDDELQLADKGQEHVKVVGRIEAGLAACTHLLGLITKNTRESWWVPYEIGGASGRGRQCAHLIDGEVCTLPSYIQAATILAGRQDLRSWLPKTPRRQSAIFNLTETLLAACEHLTFVPENRSVDDLNFD